MVLWHVCRRVVSIVIPVPDTSASNVTRLVAIVSHTLYQNLITSFNGWFVLYLYLVTSLALSSPSSQDLKNAIIGIILLICASVCIITVNFSTMTSVFLTILGLFGTGLGLGLTFELIALFVSLPALLVYRRTYETSTGRT